VAPGAGAKAKPAEGARVDRPSQPALANGARGCGGVQAAGANAGASKLSIMCKGSRQVRELKKIPMRNSLEGLNTGRIEKIFASAGMCLSGGTAAFQTKRPPPAEATRGPPPYS